MLEKKNIIQNEVRTVLVGVINKDQTDQQAHEYLDELAFLAETAGAIAVKRFTQKLVQPDSRTFVGKGKLEEIKKYVESRDIQLVIFDDELSPSQQRNLEKEASDPAVRNEFTLIVTVRFSAVPPCWCVGEGTR